MAIRATRNYFRRHNIALMLKPTIALLGVAVLGYVVAVLPLLNAASQFALASQMVSPETAAETVDSQAAAVDSQAAGVATPAVPAAPAVTAAQPNVDYFPNGYVN